VYVGLFAEFGGRFAPPLRYKYAPDKGCSNTHLITHFV